MAAPTTSTEFDRAYRAPITVWGDVRIPAEVKALVRKEGVRSTLELGCGLGRFSRYVAQQGLAATAVDFSPVAIGQAKQRAIGDASPPEYLVGDVTRLSGIAGPFDASFDIGCFHCLDPRGQQGYASEVARLLRPGATHLLWALDSSPSNLTLSPDSVQKLFASSFVLQRAEPSRRRLARSHWYWLVRG
jgi:SAM-dependent methyltransferase